MLLWILVLLLVAGLLYIRLAPSDAERWHKQAYASGMEPQEKKNGFVWRRPVTGDGKEMLRALDAIIMDTERTTRLTGAVTEGQITYVTRSKLLGFPDYTTVGIYDGLIEDPQARYLEINGRLRFGGSDLGVNRQRIEGWIDALEAGG